MILSMFLKQPSNRTVVDGEEGKVTENGVKWAIKQLNYHQLWRRWSDRKYGKISSQAYE